MRIKYKRSIAFSRLKVQQCVFHVDIAYLVLQKTVIQGLVYTARLTFMIKGLLYHESQSCRFMVTMQLHGDHKVPIIHHSVSLICIATFCEIHNALSQEY